VAAEQTGLQDGLGRATVAKLRRTIRAQHQERNTGQEGLGDGGQEVRRRGARRTHEHDGPAPSARQAQAEEARPPLVEEREATQARRGRRRSREGSRA
jgi:hypothetical protein